MGACLTYPDSYMIMRLGLLGPLTAIGTTIGREIHRQVDSRLREHFTQPIAVAANSTRTVRDEEDESVARKMK